MNKLTKIGLNGFKTIRQLADFSLGSRNILIGPNGAGKSNFISFFRLLNWMVASSPGNMQFYVSKVGGANGLLFDGSATTPLLEASLEFETEAGTNEYNFRLFHAAPDTFIFADERYRFSRHGFPQRADWRSLGGGHRESMLIQAAEEGDQTARVIRTLLRQCVVYQFHNTTESARVLQRWHLDDNRYMKEDGANLAPFLTRLREESPESFERIRNTLRRVLPLFDEFVLEPSNGSVLLQWREKDSNAVFGPHQASDGTLRTMALLTLLLQPVEDLPDVLILDEPELGLHPFALNVLAGVIDNVSQHKQVIIATQSAPFLDYFESEDVIVVERDNRASQFHRHEGARLDDWVEDYTLERLFQEQENTNGQANGSPKQQDPDPTKAFS